MRGIPWYVLFLCVGIVALGPACESDDDDGDAAAADEAVEDAGEAAIDEAVEEADNVDVEGLWTGTRSSGSGSTDVTFEVRTQEAGAIAGVYTESGGYGTLTGTIDGDDIEFTVEWATGAFAGQTWVFNGAVNAAGDDMNGTITLPGGDHDLHVTK